MQKIPETLTWKAHSHIQHKRSFGWYFIFGLVILGLLAYAYYTQSVITGLTFLLIAIVVLALTSQPSREVTYKVTKTGIVVGKVIYPFKIIKKFWIIYSPPEITTLNLETTAYINNRVIIQLGHQDPITLKLLLGNYLPEDLDMEETVTESLARRLKI